MNHTCNVVQGDTRPIWISDHAAESLLTEVREGTKGCATIRKHIHAAVGALNAVTWDTAPYATFNMLLARHYLGVPAKVRGSIKVLNSTVPEPTGGDLTDTLTLQLEDREGCLLETATIRDAGLIAKARSYFPGYPVLDFLGCVVPKANYSPADRHRGLTYAFLLADIVVADDPLQMIQATTNEIRYVEQLVHELSAIPGGIIDYIRTQLVQIIGLRGLEASPLLDRSLSAMILQGLSDGGDASGLRSHRIHTLVIGSPAVGKKLLVEAGRILNPAYTEGHPAKLSAPGLSGSASYRDGAWQSEPGLIPLAHKGLFAVQDFHHAARKKDILGVLSLAMEDGLVVDSTAAKKKHCALTAIHLDLNRHSDIYLTGQGSQHPSDLSRLTDVGLSLNVLTRFDYIAAIPRDTERQMQIALLMHSGEQRTTRHLCARRESPAARTVKVLVAYLRSRYAEIVIPAEVTENAIRAKQKELLEINREQLDQLHLLGDFQTRLSNSIDKFVYALARGNARSTATPDDVEAAFGFIYPKMEFLSTLEAFKIPSSWESGSEAEKVRARRQHLLETFAGADVTVEQVHAHVLAHLDRQVSQHTIRRDLNQIADRPRHGIFRLPKRENGTLETSLCPPAAISTDANVQSCNLPFRLTDPRAV